jgi:hypothetical protein
MKWLKTAGGHVFGSPVSFISEKRIKTIAPRKIFGYNIF